MRMRNERPAKGRSLAKLSRAAIALNANTSGAHQYGRCLLWRLMCLNLELVARIGRGEHISCAVMATRVRGGRSQVFAGRSAQTLGDVHFGQLARRIQHGDAVACFAQEVALGGALVGMLAAVFSEGRYQQGLRRL